MSKATDSLRLGTEVKCKGSSEVFTLINKEGNIYTFEDPKGNKRSYIYFNIPSGVYQGTNKNITVIQKDKNLNQIQESLF